MTRSLYFIVVTVLALAAPTPYQKPESDSASRTKIPTSASIKIILASAPGIDDEASWWEINYKFRIATDADLLEAYKRRRIEEGGEDRAGELIKEGAIKQPLKAAANRTVVLQIPLTATIQERLRNQPSTLIGNFTTEQSRDYERRAQDFVFRSWVEIYDAKLGKKLLVPASRIWPFVDFPEAKFEIKIQITADGGNRVDSSWPRRGQTMEIKKP